MSPLAVLSTGWSPIVRLVVSEFRVGGLIEARLNVNRVRVISTTRDTLMNTMIVNVTGINSVTLQIRVDIMIFHIHVFTPRIIINVPIILQLMTISGRCYDRSTMGRGTKRRSHARQLILR